MGIISWGKKLIDKVKGSFTVSPRILDHFGIAAYNSIKKSLVELCSNSYDADATEIRITLPDEINNKSEIIIEDNGIGMTTEEFQSKYLHVGRDRREAGDVTDKGRQVIGNKGIGKLAGFGIARLIKIETRRQGVVTTAQLDRKKFEKNLNTSRFNVESYQSDIPGETGTRLILQNLFPDLTIPKNDVLRRYLRKHLPDAPEFRIFVNNQECTSEDVVGNKMEFEEKIEDLDKKVTGFYIIANSNQGEGTGLSVRVRGRLVTKPSLFDARLDSFTQRISTRFVGEICADFLDDSSNKDFGSLINTARDGFIEDNEIVEAFNEWVRSFIKKTLKEENQKNIKKQLDSILSNNDFKKRLDSLPKTIKTKAKNMIQSALPKLRNDDDVEMFVDLILRYFESSVMRNLLSSILEAKSQDVEKLAEMISEWGVREVASVTDIVGQKIKIIRCLEDLVQNAESLETPIHKIFEKNLWILNEKYKLWASNRQLKSILDKEIDGKYKNKKKLRPDIVCFSNSENSSAVVIEFKRPKDKITEEHLTQALQYKGIIKKTSPNIEEIKVFVVGYSYNASIASFKSDQEKAGNFFHSYTEILHDAEKRFESILNVLNGEDLNEGEK